MTDAQHAELLEETDDHIEELKNPGLFVRCGNWASRAIGGPPNFAFWFVLVAVWTCVFAFGGRHLASGTWLPSWFTSTGYNFPLNLITTVMELFIGFLVAAAANRAQDALTLMLQNMRVLLMRINAAITLIQKVLEAVKAVDDEDVAIDRKTYDAVKAIAAKLEIEAA